MAPSGTVEVCRGPAAPRDASGAEVCVPCVCRSLSNNDTKAQNPKKTILSENSGTVPTGGEQSPQSLKFVGNSPHTVPIRGTSGGTVPTHMGNSPHDLGNSPHQPNSPQ